jgi:5-formyltetrahydrofolate cyclo-ligase
LNIITQNKRDLRKVFRERLNLLTGEERILYDSLIHESLLYLPEFIQAQTVMTYLSFSGEVNTFCLAKSVLEQGKNLIVPRVQSDPRNLIPCHIISLEGRLIPNQYGILEPDVNHYRPVPPGNIDLHVIPGLAFDRKGYRLGHGGGYYDRFLTQISRHAFTVGLCYNCQMLESIPIDSWDIPVQCIITEKEILHIEED